MSKFEQGHEKLGGRQKGTKNKRTEIQDILDQHNFDPVSNIMQKLSELSSKEAIQVSLDLLPYIHPKKRAVEIINDVKDDNIDPETARMIAEALVGIKKLDIEKAIHRAFELARERGLVSPTFSDESSKIMKEVLDGITNELQFSAVKEEP